VCATRRETELRKEVERLTARLATLEAAVTRAQGEVSTNEFWADGMRVGKRVGFGLGVEAAAKWLDAAEHNERFTSDDMIRALAQRGEGA
jgi:hypothetical protein